LISNNSAWNREFAKPFRRSGKPSFLDLESIFLELIASVSDYLQSELQKLVKAVNQ